MTSRTRSFFLGGTTGLGLELAKIAASEFQHEVTVAGRSAKKCSLVTSKQATAFILDLKSPTLPLPDDLGPFDWIVCTAGAGFKGDLLSMSPESINSLISTNLSGPILVLTELLRRQAKKAHPCRMIIVSSTTSWRIRSDEAVYGAVKAGMAQFARNLRSELKTQLPGSHVLLVNPGGMATPFWDGSQADTRVFMDPKAVAKVIWDLTKHPDIVEVQIIRQPNGVPKFEFGAHVPELSLTPSGVFFVDTCDHNFRTKKPNKTVRRINARDTERPIFWRRTSPLTG